MSSVYDISVDCESSFPGSYFGFGVKFSNKSKCSVLDFKRFVRQALQDQFSVRIPLDYIFVSVSRQYISLEEKFTEILISDHESLVEVVKLHGTSFRCRYFPESNITGNKAKKETVENLEKLGVEWNKKAKEERKEDELHEKNLKEEKKEKKENGLSKSSLFHSALPGPKKILDKKRPGARPILATENSTFASHKGIPPLGQCCAMWYDELTTAMEFARDYNYVMGFNKGRPLVFRFEANTVSGCELISSVVNTELTRTIICACSDLSQDFAVVTFESIDGLVKRDFVCNMSVVIATLEEEFIEMGLLKKRHASHNIKFETADGTRFDSHCSFYDLKTFLDFGEKKHLLKIVQIS